MLAFEVWIIIVVVIFIIHVCVIIFYVSFLQEQRRQRWKDAQFSPSAHRSNIELAQMMWDDLIRPKNLTFCAFNQTTLLTLKDNPFISDSMAKWTCPGKLHTLKMKICLEWQPFWKYEMGLWLEIWSNNRWDWSLNKSIKPSLVTAISHSCLVNHHRCPYTCLSRRVYWYLSVSIITPSITFHFPLQTAINFQMETKAFSRQGSTYRVSAKTYKHNKDTKGGGVRLRTGHCH